MLTYELMTLRQELQRGDVILMDTFPASRGDEAQSASNRAAIMRHCIQYGMRGGFSAPLTSVETGATIGLFATVAGLTAHENDGPDQNLLAILPRYR
jgi:hypothetical protein